MNANKLIKTFKVAKVARDAKLKDETYYVYLESPAGTELIGSGDYAKAQRIKAEKEKNWHRGDSWSVVVTNKQMKETNAWDSIKDASPKYAIWVKKDGKWVMWGGSNTSAIDKSDFLSKGYSDVRVVRNGEEVQDSNEVDYDYLTEEEQKAVNDYRQAIQSTNNPKLIELFEHILQEEKEHIEEINKAKNGEIEVQDAVKDSRTLIGQTFKVKHSLANLGIKNVKVIDVLYNGRIVELYVEALDGEYTGQHYYITLEDIQI